MTSIADIQMTTIAPRVESIAVDIMLLFSEDDFRIRKSHYYCVATCSIKKNDEKQRFRIFCFDYLLRKKL